MEPILFGLIIHKCVGNNPKVIGSTTVVGTECHIWEVVGGEVVVVEVVVVGGEVVQRECRDGEVVGSIDVDGEESFGGRCSSETSS